MHVALRMHNRHAFGAGESTGLKTKYSAWSASLRERDPHALAVHLGRSMPAGTGPSVRNAQQTAGVSVGFPSALLPAALGRAAPNDVEAGRTSLGGRIGRAS